jgi:hypothetical protein
MIDVMTAHLKGRLDVLEEYYEHMDNCSDGSLGEYNRIKEEISKIKAVLNG